MKITPVDHTQISYDKIPSAKELYNLTVLEDIDEQNDTEIKSNTEQVIWGELNYRVPEQLKVHASVKRDHMLLELRNMEKSCSPFLYDKNIAGEAIIKALQSRGYNVHWTSLESERLSLKTALAQYKCTIPGMFELYIKWSIQ